MSVLLVVKTIAFNLRNEEKNSSIDWAKSAQSPTTLAHNVNICNSIPRLMRQARWTRGRFAFLSVLPSEYGTCRLFYKRSSRGSNPIKTSMIVQICRNHIKKLRNNYAHESIDRWLLFINWKTPRPHKSHRAKYVHTRIRFVPIVWYLVRKIRDKNPANIDQKITAFNRAIEVWTNVTDSCRINKAYCLVAPISKYSN